MLTLFHGSEKIIEHPVAGGGKVYNDYGPGFYMTESADLAREWSVVRERDGFINQYRLDTAGLRLLFLNRGDYHILNWLAILLDNRTFSPAGDLAQEAKAYVLGHFLQDYKSYDVICGYRADDSYFSFAGAFLNNSISLQQLGQAMRLGKLGEQYTLKSEKAFKQLHYVGCEAVPAEIWFPKREERDRKAREAFRRSRGVVTEGIYMVDILRERWENEDVRLR